MMEMRRDVAEVQNLKHGHVIAASVVPRPLSGRLSLTGTRYNH